MIETIDIMELHRGAALYVRSKHGQMHGRHEDFAQTCVVYAMKNPNRAASLRWNLARFCAETFGDKRYPAGSAERSAFHYSYGIRGYLRGGLLKDIADHHALDAIHAFESLPLPNAKGSFVRTRNTINTFGRVPRTNMKRRRWSPNFCCRPCARGRVDICERKL